MPRFSVAKYWWDVDAPSSDTALELSRDLEPSSGWASPDPRLREQEDSDPLLAEAAYLLREWGSVANHPGLERLYQRSHVVAEQLRQRLEQGS